MLVLVSFALVLLAAGLLLVGLAVDSGLTLIYASIGCSLAAGVLLILATRSRRGAPVPPPAPAAEVDDRYEGRPAEGRPPEAPSEADIWAPPPAAREAPATGSEGSGGAPALPAEADYLFPIGDYEQRPVSEILPLLTHLYEDELDMVEARERRGAGREAVLSRVAELRRRFQPAPYPAPGAGPGPGPADLPIPGYATLRVPEVRAALGRLSLAELDEVRAYEEAGDRRQAVLEAIERRRAALVEATGPPTEDRPGTERP